MSAATTAPVVLAARGLSAGYHGVPVVRDVDLEVRAGEVVLLGGPNGAGKTTTMMTLAGALRPLGGVTELDGSATTMPMHKRVRLGLDPDEAGTEAGTEGAAAGGAAGLDGRVGALGGPAAGEARA